MAQQAVDVILQRKVSGRMIDARNYAVHERLKNGLQVTIRAIRPDDRDALQAAFKELDKRTILLFASSGRRRN